MTTLTTPSGRPASRQASANISEVSGVSSAGLSTMVLPAAIAGQDLPGGHLQRVVPRARSNRRRRSARAGRLRCGQPEYSPVALPSRCAGGAGEEGGVVDRPGDVELAGQLDRLARLQALGAGEQVGALLEDRGEPREQRRARDRGSPSTTPRRRTSPPRPPCRRRPAWRAVRSPRSRRWRDRPRRGTPRRPRRSGRRRTGRRPTTRAAQMRCSPGLSHLLESTHPHTISAPTQRNPSLNHARRTKS